MYHATKEIPKALVLISPKSKISQKEKKGVDKLLRIPNFIFELLRYWDRSGGLYSTSVNRGLHITASQELRKRQLRWNIQNDTPTLKRTLSQVQWATQNDYEKIHCPTLLIAGQEDHVTPPSHMHVIDEWIRHGSSSDRNIKRPICSKLCIPNTSHQVMLENAG